MFSDEDHPLMADTCINDDLASRLDVEINCPPSSLLSDNDPVMQQHRLSLFDDDDYLIQPADVSSTSRCHHREDGDDDYDGLDSGDLDDDRVDLSEMEVNNDYCDSLDNDLRSPLTVTGDEDDDDGDDYDRVDVGVEASYCVEPPRRGGRGSLQNIHSYSSVVSSTNTSSSSTVKPLSAAKARTAAARRRSTVKSRLSAIAGRGERVPNSAAASSASATASSLKRKCKLYELGPLADPEAERCRLNALNAKKNRERKKAQLEEAATEIERLRDENRDLRSEAEAVRDELQAARDELAQLRSQLKTVRSFGGGPGARLDEREE